MRRLPLATLLLTIATLCAVGCQQTAGPASTGPLTPIGPLAPVGAGQAPALTPFGGTTKVTPPATGSYAAPNNYMGGVVPGGQASVSGGSSQGFAAPGNNVIGSGVQVAGWNETNTVVAGGGPTAIGQSPSPTSTFGPAADGGSNPRSGGMQVIDLTGAPPPPGYRPSVPGPYPVAPQQNWQHSAPVQIPQTQPLPNSFHPGPGARAIQPPRAGEIADRLRPVPTGPGHLPAGPASAGSGFARTATAPVPGPSTEPVTSGNPNAASPTLPWRQPGTRF